MRSLPAARKLSRRGGDAFVDVNEAGGPAFEAIEARLLMSSTVTGLEILSLTPGGDAADGLSLRPAISADGHYAAFTSTALDLTAGVTQPVGQLYLRDLQTNQTTLVTKGYDGSEANDLSIGARLSADGRYMVFESLASNLVAGDGNGTWDVFLYDRQSQAIWRVSRDTGGNDPNNRSGNATISADGRYIAYMSQASDLVADDHNGTWDVFLFDTQTSSTTRVSVNPVGGAEGNDASGRPALSADGRFVAFESLADNLVTGDGNFESDVFVLDRVNGALTRVSVASGGDEAGGSSSAPSISDDGRLVAFESQATNLGPAGDTYFSDIFVHDRQTGQITRLSQDPDGSNANEQSYKPMLSADGKVVVYESMASNLVAGDVDGNFGYDIFMTVLSTGQTMRLSRDPGGPDSDGFSTNPAVNGDGTMAVFDSDAANLVSPDGNSEADIFLAHVSHPAATLPGDFNADGLVNVQDINPFVLALGNLAAYMEQYPQIAIADVELTGDGLINVQDINPFVTLLAGGGSAGVAQGTEAGTGGAQSLSVAGSQPVEAEPAAVEPTSTTDEPVESSSPVRETAPEDSESSPTMVEDDAAVASVGGSTPTSPYGRYWSVSSGAPVITARQLLSDPDGLDKPVSIFDLLD
ncbi:MAG: PD40 domain-containing protein [Phycisphaeraceae bacterium]|nr:PD40 domain-containing protein [Phycisphaeraceae bacterium]